IHASGLLVRGGMPMARSAPPAPELVLSQPLPAHRTRLVAWGRAEFRAAPALSLCFVTLAVACAICAPLFAPYDPIQNYLDQTLVHPTPSAHLVGTEHLGRDILSRLVDGVRISVPADFLAVLV